MDESATTTISLEELRISPSCASSDRLVVSDVMESLLVITASLASLLLAATVAYLNMSLVQPSLWFFFHPWCSISFSSTHFFSVSAPTTFFFLMFFLFISLIPSSFLNVYLIYY